MIPRMEHMSATEFRTQAAAHVREAAESFDRCDTDGFLSQWAHGINANLLNAKADIAENGGKAKFVGLYHGTERIAAKVIDGKFGTVWMLRDDAAAKFGRKFVPVGRTSKVQKSLGMCERPETAPAIATILGSGHGLSGTAWVATVRADSRAWGLDSELLIGCEES